MTQLHPANERIIGAMIALARCTQQDRIIVAGSKAIELVFMLEARGYLRAAATVNCGHPTKQYRVALVDWRQRSLQALETVLDWLVDYLKPAGVLVVWVDSQKPAAKQNLNATLQRYGFRVEAGTAYEYGYAISARRLEIDPISQAA